MKTIFKLILVFLTIITISCNKEDVTENLNTTTQNRPGDPPPPVELGYSDITSTYINDGISTTCAKNILIFPSWARYTQVMDYLDNQTETYCNAFDATVPVGTSDDAYDALALAATPIPFDEDNKLKEFENSLQFCSLRLKLNTLENNWLAIQGDGIWNPNTDPDNHFIDEDTERAMLNEGVEVIIGTKLNGIIYKFTEDGGYYTIANMDYAALQQINSGIIPVGNTNVVKVEPPKPNSNTSICKGDVSYRNYFSTGSDTKIKTVDKIKNRPTSTFMTETRIKAKTKYYRKKLGVWSKGKTTITAKIEGLLNVGFVYQGCGPEYSISVTKTKRRNKVKAKQTYWDTEIFHLQNKVFATHKRREDVIKIIDFNNGNVQ